MNNESRKKIKHIYASLYNTSRTRSRTLISIYLTKLPRIKSLSKLLAFRHLHLGLLLYDINTDTYTGS